jgi:hypothetical protein
VRVTVTGLIATVATTPDLKAFSAPAASPVPVHLVIESLRLTTKLHSRPYRDFFLLSLVVLLEEDVVCI